MYLRILPALYALYYVCVPIVPKIMSTEFTYVHVSLPNSHICDSWPQLAQYTILIWNLYYQ